MPLNNCPAQNLELKVQEGKEPKYYCILTGEQCKIADYQVCPIYWNKVLPLEQNIYKGMGVPISPLEDEL